jgi:hypothetical protein
MVNDKEAIGYLNRVTLDMEWDGGEAPFELIFGIGSKGLSPFEMELSGKGLGYEVEFNLTREKLGGLFQHLLPPVCFDHIPEVFTLKVRVVRIAQADQREIIKAMAEASSCGSHCCGH